MNTHLEVLKIWFDRVWHQQDAKAIHEMLEPDIRAHGLGEELMSNPDQFAAFHQAVCRLITGIRITVDDSVNSGEWIWAQCTVRAKARASGQSIQFRGVLICRIRNEKLVEGMNHFDFLGLYSQLGLLPADTFPRCLSGSKVA